MNPRADAKEWAVEVKLTADIIGARFGVNGLELANLAWDIVRTAHAEQFQRELVEENRAKASASERA